jgi:hypothetical protein
MVSVIVHSSVGRRREIDGSRSRGDLVPDDAPEPRDSSLTPRWDIRTRVRTPVDNRAKGDAVEEECLDDARAGGACPRVTIEWPDELRRAP